MASILILFLAMLLIPVVFLAVLIFWNVFLFDSILASFICGVSLFAGAHVHPVICILFGSGIFILLTALTGSRKGSIILSFLSSAIFGILSGFIAFQALDAVWGIFIGLSIFGAGIALHIYHREKIAG